MLAKGSFFSCWQIPRRQKCSKVFLMKRGIYCSLPLQKLHFCRRSILPQTVPIHISCKWQVVQKSNKFHILLVSPSSCSRTCWLEAIPFFFLNSLIHHLQFWKTEMSRVFLPPSSPSPPTIRRSHYYTFSFYLLSFFFFFLKLLSIIYKLEKWRCLLASPLHPPLDALTNLV